MKIGTNKTDPEKGSKRHYKNEAEAGKQKKAEGKNTPFQQSLRHAEKRGKKVFWWDDKKKVASDEAFSGGRPIATNTRGENKGISTDKVKVKPMHTSAKGTPDANIKVPKPSVKAVTEQSHKGKRTHGTVKNTLLRNIDAAIQPEKYGAPSNHGKNININRSTKHSSEKPKVKGYDYNMGDGKTVRVKKVTPKAVIKAAKKKGYIQ